MVNGTKQYEQTMSGKNQGLVNHFLDFSDNIFVELWTMYTFLRLGMLLHDTFNNLTATLQNDNSTHVVWLDRCDVDMGYENLFAVSVFCGH